MHPRWRNQCSFGPKADQARRHRWNPRRSHRGKEDRKNFGTGPNCIRLHGNCPAGLGGRHLGIQTRCQERRWDRKENGGLTKKIHSRLILMFRCPPSTWKSRRQSPSLIRLLPLVLVVVARALAYSTENLSISRLRSQPV